MCIYSICVHLTAWFLVSNAGGSDSRFLKQSRQLLTIPYQTCHALHMTDWDALPNCKALRQTMHMVICPYFPRSFQLLEEQCIIKGMIVMKLKDVYREDYIPTGEKKIKCSRRVMWRKADSHHVLSVPLQRAALNLHPDKHYWCHGVGELKAWVAVSASSSTSCVDGLA